jgi:caffeoyl-CoA O-methyltransferase
MPAFKTLNFTPELHNYIRAHTASCDAIQLKSIERTMARFRDDARRQISPEQGPFLTMLVQLVGAKRAVEVGTFTGYSALSIVRGLPDDGSLLCCDINLEWTSMAHELWAEAGVTDRIELKIAPAIDTLRQLPLDAPIDFAFVDADKVGYWGYHQALLPRMRPGGLMVYDNVLFRGQVVDPDAVGPARAIRDFNRKLAHDPRVDSFMLPVADGMTLARKR